MDVVKEWADMVKCRPVDLGPSFARRLKKLESKIRDAEALEIAEKVEDRFNPGGVASSVRTIIEHRVRNRYSE